jgi:hypothetical protein
MNVNQLIAWLKDNGITLSERVSVEGGEVLTFVGTRPLPWDGRPEWTSLPIKTGQMKVTRKEIETMLRHFAHLELAIPRSARAAAACDNIGVQPLHPEIPESEEVTARIKPRLEN